MEQTNHENLFRKLHSLAGIIPLGIFLTFHLSANFTAVWGKDAYSVTGLIGKIPYVYLLEIFVIFLPIFFHGLYGVYIASQAKNNVTRFHYAKNWYFYFQRLTGIIAFAFIIWHVWQTKMQVAMGAVGAPDFNMMANIVANPFYLILYIIGILSAVYHFTHGIWTFLITWGITISPKSQTIFHYISIACFLILSFIGVRAILAFV